MFTVSATTEINATPGKVWQTITQMDQYEAWNTQLFYLGGTLAKGEINHLKLVPKGQKGYEFKPEVIVFRPHQEFAWVGRTGFKGIFDGEHHFVLEDLDNGKTLLRNYEVYSGLLSPLMQRLPMMKGAEAGFELMNLEIKKRAESL